MNSIFMESGKGRQCTIADCSTGRYHNETEDKYIQFVLMDDDHQICNQRFVKKGQWKKAFMSFAKACGLDAATIKSPKRGDFIGRCVEVDVIMNDAGYPAVQLWRKAAPLDEAHGDDDSLL